MSGWVIQQLREAFPYDSAPGYLILDRASRFNADVIDAVKAFSQSEPASAARGKTASPSASSATAIAICSAM
jgi:hypothetical protein